MSTATGEDRETPEQLRTRLRKVRLATIVGTTVEWFDFYLYATMASIVFGTVFFPSGDPETATLSAFATFAVGFIARPLGGIVFGHLGDPIGRKRVLVLTFALMGGATTLIGLLPGYETIGFWAPVALVVLRILQGMGAGAEYASAAVNSYEHAAINRRGRQGAWPAFGLNLGLVLSSATIFLLTLNGQEFLLSGGWRIPFLASALLIAIGIWVRNSLPESPAFEKQVVQAHRKAPFKAVFAGHWRGMLVVFLLAIGYNAMSYIYKTFSVAYLTQYRDVSANVSSGAIMVAGLVAMAVVVVSGELCDRFSARVVTVAGGVVASVYAFVFVALLDDARSWSVYVAIGVGTGVIAPLLFSAQGAYVSRQFPPNVRSTGIGVARETGTAVAGGLAPLGALSLVAASPTNSTVGVALTLAVAGLITLSATIFDQGRRFSADRN